jgi:hypothetical protein
MGLVRADYASLPRHALSVTGSLRKMFMASIEKVRHQRSVGALFFSPLVKSQTEAANVLDQISY